MHARGERIIVFGDSLTQHSSGGAEIWDVDAGSNRSSSAPGDLLASLLAEQGAEAVRTNARVSRSAWNFWSREDTARLLQSDAAFRPTKVVFVLGTNDVGLNPTLDREAFIKLRDAYKAMGAEVWAIGPFANTSKSAAGVEQVAQTMRGVFGGRFIDGRPLSVLIHPGGDGLHYSAASARPLALAMADALLSKLSPTTLISSFALGALGIGAAVIAGLAWKRHKARGLGKALANGVGALSRKDQKMIEETLTQPGVESLDVVQDALLERNERLSTFAKTGGELGPHTTAYYQLDLGRDKITWWLQHKGMNRCEARFSVQNDGIVIAPTPGSVHSETDAEQGRNPAKSEAWIDGYYGGPEYCERSAASTAWQIAKTLKRMPGIHRGNIELINNAVSDVSKAIEKALDQDHSEPEELYGLGADHDDFKTYQAKTHLPEAEARQKFADMIREPDPDIMDLAEDFALEQEIPIADKGRKRSGALVLHPHGAADAPQTIVYWNVGAQGKEQSDIEIIVDFNRASISRLHDRLEKLTKQLQKRGESEYKIGQAINAEIDKWSREGGDPMTGVRIERLVRQNVDVNKAARLGAAIAWNVAKRLKRMPATADETAIGAELSEVMRERNTLLHDRPGLYGTHDRTSGKDVSFHELIREDDPNVMTVAEDLLLERGWKLTQGFIGGTRHYTVDMGPVEQRALWKKAGASVETQPGDGGPGTYPSDQSIRRTIRLFAYNGQQEPVERKVEIKATIDEARKYAAAATWAMAKEIKPRELDTDVSDVVYETARKLRRAGDRKKLLQPSELFGLDGVEIVDGKRYDGSTSKLVREGYRETPCASGLDKKGIARCWSKLAGLAGYRVAYGTSDPQGTFRVFDDRVLPTIEAATKLMRSYKRQGLWTWVEDEQGNFVPVPGAKRESVRKSYPLRSTL